MTIRRPRRQPQHNDRAEVVAGDVEADDVVVAEGGNDPQNHRQQLPPPQQQLYRRTTSRGQMAVSSTIMPIRTFPTS